MSNKNQETETITPQLKKMIKMGKKNPEKLWKPVAEELNWFEKWDKVYEEKKTGKFSWFKGGKTNLSYNCLDY